jgi:hypothetical protein
MLDDRGISARFLAEVRNYVHRVQSSFADASLFSTLIILCGVKRQEREADHSHRCSIEIKKEGAVTTLPDTSSRHGA